MGQNGRQPSEETIGFPRLDIASALTHTYIHIPAEASETTKQRPAKRARRKDTTMQPFTPQTTTLVLIDHQVGTMQLIKNIDRDFAAKQAVALAKMAKILGIPTILTASQEDRAQGPLLPELSSILPDAYAARIKRPGVVNAWAYPPFKAAVVATRKKNLIMAGVTTDVWLIFPGDRRREGRLRGASRNRRVRVAEQYIRRFGAPTDAGCGRRLDRH
jgi:hypothetical protein